MQDFTDGTDVGNSDHYVLRLFVTGTSANSARAIHNLQIICEEHLQGRYDIEIIDIHQQPLLVRDEDVAAVPMLIKKYPLPMRRLVGDMSETDKVLKGLGLK